ncbi:MAG: serine acetyltransferase [Prevotella sp.]|nr:serine acetyltransferase [Prevotella sp.]
MSTHKLTHVLTGTVDRLSQPESLKGLFHQHRDGYPLPSSAALEEIVQLSRAILFPGYFGKSQVNIKTIKFQIGVDVERLHQLLSEQVLAGLCFGDEPGEMENLPALKAEASDIAGQLIARLPDVRHILSTDITAAYNGDPAATSFSEILSCYPVIKTLTIFRIAHELFLLGVPLIPRMMAEMAHSETGIDIHPGATIGEYFTIDHGTGVVIGETCIIGKNVKLYQGVTLGARSFPLDDDGNPIKGIARHPIIEDDVVIYANATVLGRITIGKGCVVGANTWVMEDMAPSTRKYNRN